MSNPLLEAIHGVSLEDYAAISAKMSEGIPIPEILKALTIEQAIFEEANALWVARMQEDSTYEVTTLFGQFFANANNHPLLSNLKAQMSEEGAANLEKMKTDRYFFEEMNGARQAAYAYGLDGAQWIQENYEINLGDFQSVSIQWMTLTANDEVEETHKFYNYREQKETEYGQKFAKEQGGNIADDVEF